MGKSHHDWNKPFLPAPLISLRLRYWLLSMSLVSRLDNDGAATVTRMTWWHGSPWRAVAKDVQKMRSFFGKLFQVILAIYALSEITQLSSQSVNTIILAPTSPQPDNDKGAELAALPKEVTDKTLSKVILDASYTLPIYSEGNGTRIHSCQNIYFPLNEG